MKHLFMILVTSVMAIVSGKLMAQKNVVVSDHRHQNSIGGDIQKKRMTGEVLQSSKVIRVPILKGAPPASVGNMDNNMFPKDINKFTAVDLTTAGDIFVKDFTTSAELSKVVMGNVIHLDRGLSSNPLQDPYELILIADSLIITGNILFDLSKNKFNLNGYFGIICRNLLLSDNALLQVDLAVDGQQPYRRFFLMAESVFVQNKKIYAIDSTLRKHVQLKGNNGFRNGYMGPDGKTLTGQANFTLGPASSNASYNPVTGIGVYDNLADALRPLPEFNDFFSRWVVAMHEKIYGDMTKAALQDKFTLAQKYLQLKAMPEYELQGNYSGRLNGIRSKIREIVKSLGPSQVFTSVVKIGDKPKVIVSTMSSDRINNFMLPDKCIVQPYGVDSIPRLGYLLVDEKNMNEFALEFDVRLDNDSLQFQLLKDYLSTNNRRLEAFDGQIDLSNLFLEGQELIAEKCKVVPVARNLYKIRMVATTGSSLLFYKLFTGINTDVFIKGEYDHIPVRIPLVLKYGISFGKDGAGDAKIVELPLNADRFGDYFEQIDGSDQMRQTLFIYNNLSAAPKDTLSGSLEYVDLRLSYNDGIHNVLRSLQLSPANSMDHQAQVEILRMRKKFIPFTISGTARYENATYVIKPVTTKEGELSLYITDVMLGN